MTANTHPVRSSSRWLFLWLAVLLLAAGTISCASRLPDNVQRPRSVALEASDQTALGQLVQTRRTQARARADSAFMLLDSGEAALTSRLALVERAQKTLDLQYYAIHADASTEVILQAVREAARRGVRVRILLDDFNTVGQDAQVLRLAFIPGIEMRLFNPVPGSRGSLLGRVLGSLHDVERLQKRMHNKVFIADNAWGITGGRNLGAAYFGGDGKSAFVDLDVLAAGTIVRQMSASFDRFWNDDLAYPVQALLSRQDLERLRERGEPSRGADAAAAPPAAAGQVLPNVSAGDAASARQPAMDLQRLPLTWAPSVLLVDKPGKVGPGDDEADAGDTLIDGLLQLIRDAREEVVIVSPYFVPGAQMMEVFAELRRRGIAVRVLTNSLASNDAPLAHAGYQRYRRQLLTMGVALHEMRADPASVGLQGGSAPHRDRASGIGFGSSAGGSRGGSSRASLHSKAVVIDRRLVVVGSMNLDLRSQRQNSEVALVIRSATLSQAAVRLVEDTFARAAWRLELAGDGLVWRAPPGAPFQDADREPEAGLTRRLLVDVLGPFAPDEML